MNIHELKATLDIATLNLNTAMDANNAPTEWLRHWDNDRRIAVSIHKETFGKVKADSTVSTLGIQTEMRNGSKGEYTAHRIVLFTPAEHTL